MTGLVRHHISQELLEQRLVRHHLDEAEGGERQTFDHYLHPQVGHVPSWVGDDLVEEHLEVGVDRVVPRQLLVEIAGEHLHVPGLVHHLGGGVVLGVDPRDGRDDLGRAEQGALLAVEELRQRPVLRLHPEPEPLIRAPRGHGAVRQADAP